MYNSTLKKVILSLIVLKRRLMCNFVNQISWSNSVQKDQICFGQYHKKPTTVQVSTLFFSCLSEKSLIQSRIDISFFMAYTLSLPNIETKSRCPQCSWVFDNLLEILEFCLLSSSIHFCFPIKKCRYLIFKNIEDAETLQ